MKDIYVVGDGGFAKEVAFLIDEINKIERTWNFRGFVSLNKKPGEKFHNSIIVGNNDYLLKLDYQFSVVIAIGNPKVLKKVVTEISQNTNYDFCNLIHPSVVADWANMEIGTGNIIASGVTFTTDIKVGSHNIFNLNCTVGHDTVIGNYNVFNPGCNISGSVIIEDESLFGTGCQVLQNLSVVEKTTIGAGAVLTKDVKSSGTYIGIPAKKIH